MKEYVIEQGKASDVQKKLNQWRHNYFIEILSCSFYADEIIVILTRSVKPKI